MKKLKLKNVPQDWNCGINELLVALGEVKDTKNIFP